MPFTIPNTTLLDQYDAATTFGANDVFAWGFFTVANNGAFVSLAEGPRGQGIFQDEVFCPPATYPIAGGGRPIAGLRARNAVVGSPAQFFGSLFYPNEPGIQAGTPFTSTITPGGGVGVAGTVSILNLLNTDVAATGVGETTIYSASIAAGALSANSLIKVEIGGDLLYNNNLADTLRLRVRLNGTEVISDTFATVLTSLSANRQPWSIVTYVGVQTVASSQWVDMDFNLPDGNLGGATVGIGDLSDLNAGRRSGGTKIAALGAVDLSIASTVAITAAWSSASANNQFRKRRAAATLYTP